MKLAFMGSDPIALPLLDFLAAQSSVELIGVFTQPDRRTGRGMKLQPNAIKGWALERGIEVLQPVKCGATEAEWLRIAGIEVVVVMAYGQILPKSVLAAVPGRFLNFHASLLPRLRGASPIHTAVALGLPETGVSLMQIEPKLDAGPLADVERIPISPEDNTAAVHARMATACPALMRRALAALASGSLAFLPQDDARATYCRIIEKSDAHLDFHVPATVLAARVRAFQPWPGTAFPHDDQEIRIHAAFALADDSGAAPGTVLNPMDGGLPIACAKGILIATSLQRPGGRPLPAADFLRGYAIPAGELLASRPMRPLEAGQPFPWKRS